MTYAEKIFEEAKSLSELEQAQVLDFAQYLRQKRALEKVMDDIITDNLEAFTELAK